MRINLHVGYKKFKLNFILFRYLTHKTVVVVVDYTFFIVKLKTGILMVYLSSQYALKSHIVPNFKTIKANCHYDRCFLLT